MNTNELNFVGNHIKKLRKVFLIIVGVICAFELALTVRGLVIFNLKRLKHRLYLYSYLFLLIASAATLIVNFFNKNSSENVKFMIAQTYIYSACLIVWATFVTGIDCVANGDSGVMVYIMVCISIGVLTVIKPLYYGIILSSSGAALIGIVWALRGQPYSMGFYINFAVFIAIAIFINAQNYRLSRREYESTAKLNRLSYTDQLTGIYNRRHLDSQILEYSNANRRYLFMLVDVDNFKLVNDTHGHAVGDECLVTIASRMVELFGEKVYRFGGDEFAVICDLDEVSVCKNVDKINALLKNSYEGIDLSLSAGAYTAAEDDEASLVFIRADRALYKAKADGKGVCRIFTE